ncbi:hypothetical protein MHN84_19850 [Mycobacterium sp. PSTR-4-N]|nr:hypothetical protein [Mycobacterium sp. PSTR-4-N]MCG7596251.1 hypothetical protein [Mycobacterium sp. PSTR-4-N]
MVAEHLTAERGEESATTTNVSHGGETDGDEGHDVTPDDAARRLHGGKNNTSVCQSVISG